MKDKIELPPETQETLGKLADTTRAELNKLTEALKPVETMRLRVDEIMQAVANSIQPSTISEIFRRQATISRVLYIMADAWDGVTDGDDCDDKVNALEILADAYYEAHGKEDQSDAEMKAVVERYLAYHANSGANSYSYTADLFVKEVFPTINPRDLVVKDRLAAISNSEYQFALTPRPNPYAFICPLGTGMLSDFIWDDNLGQAIDKRTKQPIIDKWSDIEIVDMMKKTAEADTVTSPDFPLLAYTYGFLYDNRIRFENNGDYIVVPLDKFAKGMGSDINKPNARDIEKQFSQYEPYLGWIYGYGLYAVLRFVKRDDIEGTITFAVPYLKRLMDIVSERSTRTYKSGRKAELGYNFLVHATIGSERNKPAVAIVIAITNLLLQNRQQPKKDEEYVISHIKFSTLADYAELSKRINLTLQPREKSRILKTCFTKAFELLRTKTDAYNYYDGLELYTMDRKGIKAYATERDKDGNLTDNMTEGKEPMNVIAPTYKEYETVLYCRHKGADKNWKHDV